MVDHTILRHVFVFVSYTGFLGKLPLNMELAIKYNVIFSFFLMATQATSTYFLSAYNYFNNDRLRGC